MPIPKDYFCDGQLNIWDYLTQATKEETQKPDDSVCEGCKWREHEKRELEVDDHGQTWVYKCPGTACANWRFGTPLNITYEAESITKPEHDFEEPSEHPYCYNRDFLPPLDWVVSFIRDYYGINLAEVKCEWDPSIEKYFIFKDKRAELEVCESRYTGGPKTGEECVGIYIEAQDQGFFGKACDNLEDIRRMVEKFEEITSGRRERKNG